MEEKSQKLNINSDIQDVYGFLILSSKNALIGTFSKENKEINFKSNFDIPKPHTKGGASANRFRRIREERIFKIFKSIEENLEKIFIKDNLLNISGLVIAGAFELIKKYLSFIKKFNEQLNEYIFTLIETDNNGELGFNEAIELFMLNN